MGPAEVVGSTFSKSLNLVPGINRFDVKFVDAAGNTTPKTLTVTYNPPTPLPTAPTTPTTNVLLLAGAAIFLVVAIVAVIFTFMRKPVK